MKPQHQTLVHETNRKTFCEPPPVSSRHHSSHQVITCKLPASEFTHRRLIAHHVMYVCVHAWADLAIEPFTVPHAVNLFLHSQSQHHTTTQEVTNRLAALEHVISSLSLSHSYTHSLSLSLWSTGIYESSCHTPPPPPPAPPLMSSINHSPACPPH